MKIKKCWSCKVEKPLTAEYFYRQSATATGFHAYCKECVAERSKEYRQKNKEAISRKQKKYHKKHYQKNKEAIGRRVKEYRQENRGAVAKYKKEYYKKNKEHLKEYLKAYLVKRRKEDPIFRLKHSMGSGLHSCLSGRTKNSRTFDYVGLTLEELMAYLGAKFTDGMTRDNYGKWHVDHIRPLASFDFYKHELGSKEFEDLLHQAWHYTNLQPLWAKDNISKGAKWDGKCR